MPPVNGNMVLPQGPPGGPQVIGPGGMSIWRSGGTGARIQLPPAPMYFTSSWTAKDGEPVTVETPCYETESVRIMNKCRLFHQERVVKAAVLYPPQK